jgi:hypothetical protein
MSLFSGTETKYGREKMNTCELANITWPAAFMVSICVMSGAAFLIYVFSLLR